jgi:hypothetical protein
MLSSADTPSQYRSTARPPGSPDSASHYVSTAVPTGCTGMLTVHPVGTAVLT